MEIEFDADDAAEFPGRTERSGGKRVSRRRGRMGWQQDIRRIGQGHVRYVSDPSGESGTQSREKGRGKPEISGYFGESGRKLWNSRFIRQKSGSGEAGGFKEAGA